MATAAKTKETQPQDAPGTEAAKKKKPKPKPKTKTKTVKLYSRGPTKLDDKVKLPKQLRVIIETLDKQKGAVSLEELSEAVDKAGIETTQPVSRIIMFYSKRMQEEGLATVEVKKLEVPAE